MRPKLQILTAAGVGIVFGIAMPHRFNGRSLLDSEHADGIAEAAMMKATVAAPLAAPPAAAPAPKPVVAAAPAPVAARAESRSEKALRTLRRRVDRQSHPNALRYAVEAYFNYKSAHPERVKKPYLYYVDYGLSSSTPRGYVFDMETLKVVEGPFTVAHGRGSGSGAIPTRFSNRNGSNSTSLGLFLTQETYAFSGSSNGRFYRSIGLRLKGLSGAFNSAALSRGVVAHGAPYVTRSRAGRSEGCPAMEPARARRLLPKISGGAMVFLFSPRDTRWLSRDPWAHADDDDADESNS
jgi:hypothetical protein